MGGGREGFFFFFSSQLLYLVGGGVQGKLGWNGRAGQMCKRGVCRALGKKQRFDLMISFDVLSSANCVCYDMSLFRVGLSHSGGGPLCDNVGGFPSGDKNNVVLLD